ncbi:RAD52 DNA repair protein [Roridomyces roridus]|uniref:RAD52 DNA repair protein n=1 Tax=Roridomyces roridus TaxID=1738132 RepID=A0AAD7BYY6_9AGAR|nr:RAD52 DNA repair protein [Roridomyces roridus]
MAGAMSGHLINSFESNRSICTDGHFSFAPHMHGSSTQNSMSFTSQASTSSGESTYDRICRLQSKLNQKLGPEFISQRPGPGGGPKLTYAEGWKVINVANEVFGFEGWSSNIVNLVTDYMDYNEETKRYNIGVSAVMRVTLKEGSFHEDVGYGMIENAKSKGTALDKCKKEAVTDGLKRTLRNFGNVLGNCLYDKQYAAEVVKIKVPPVKLDKGDLHRLPEFSASTSTSAPTSVQTPQPQQQKWQPNQDSKPITSVPRHLQQQPQQPPRANQASGLQTPITTPAAPERKVAFAPLQPKPAPPLPPPQPQLKAEPAIDDDESYGFSDDDAFMALADMTDADLGRPIDFEEGLAGSAGGNSSVVSESAAAEAAPVSRPQQAPQQVNRPPQQQQQHQQPARVGPMGLGWAGTNAGAGTGQAQAQWGALPANPSGQSNTRNYSGGNTRPPTANPVQHHQQTNQNSKPPSGMSAPPATKRPPSVGGFHFPPGMPNPLLRPDSSKPPQMPQQQQQGVKRSAEVMMQSSRGGGGPRQPLGPLALDGGAGDAKRMRQ